MNAIKSRQSEECREGQIRSQLDFRLQRWGVEQKET